MGAYTDAIAALTGLRLNARLNEPSGTSVANPGSGPDGTYNNSPTLGIDGPILTDPTSKGITLVAASTQYVEFATDTAWNWGTGDFTMGIWFKRSGAWPGAAQFVIARSGGGGATEYDFYLNASSGTWSVHVAATQVNQASGWLSDGLWHFHVVTCDRDGNATFYRDGASLGTASIAAASASDITRSAVLHLGRRSAGSYLDGSISEAFMCTQLLTPTEVANLYQLATQAKQPIIGSGFF